MVMSLLGIKVREMGGVNGKWVVKIVSVGGLKLAGVQRSMLGGKDGAGLDRNE